MWKLLMCLLVFIVAVDSFKIQAHLRYLEEDSSSEEEGETDDDPKQLPTWVNDTTSWTQYKRKKGKKINEKENVYRERIFLKNKEKVNGKNSQPGHKYFLNLNDFADLTPKEFKSMYTGLIISNSTTAIR